MDNADRHRAGAGSHAKNVATAERGKAGLERERVKKTVLSGEGAPVFWQPQGGGKGRLAQSQNGARKAALKGRRASRMHAFFPIPGFRAAGHTRAPKMPFRNAQLQSQKASRNQRRLPGSTCTAGF